jgi:glycosyltransferase involved in cell wall biosynthesis
VTFTPPPLDVEQFSPNGADVRAEYGIAGDVPLIAAIGKLSKKRGFEAVLETFAVVRRTIVNARLMIIGHGEHQPALEQIASTLGIGEAIVWAGYHEDDLADHYRATDVLLFTAAGSDEGHRAVIEAMGCGVAPGTYPIPGMRAILGDLTTRHCAQTFTPDGLSAVVVPLLSGDRGRTRVEVNQRAQLFSYERAARRLIDAYSTVE